MTIRPWRLTVIARLTVLTANSGLPDVPLGQDTARYALAALDRIMPDRGDAQPPEITATWDGGVQLEWTRDGRTVLIEIEPDGEMVAHTPPGVTLREAVDGAA